MNHLTINIVELTQKYTTNLFYALFLKNKIDYFLYLQNSLNQFLYILRF